MKLVTAGLLLGLLAACSGFGSNDDRFLKKYAMMKIYESCFGAEVVKEIRKEMKAACVKCAAPAEQEMQSNQPQNSPPNNGPARLPPAFVQVMHNNIPTYTRLGEASQDPNQNEIPQQVQVAPQSGLPEQSSLDTEKLQQAIFSYRIPQPVQGYPVPAFGYRSPFGASPYVNPFQQPYVQPWTQQPYAGPFFQQPFQFYGNRMSREMDFKNKLEVFTSRSNGKIRNVTCVMQELGYLDQNLEPNYARIAERISDLPVANDLKSDMQDGLQFCQQFAQCVPETKKENSPLSRELIKPMFFFKCYKHKKLEACIMKDIRDRFASEDELETDGDFRTISREGRVMKMDSEPTQKISPDELSSIFYDFLYGNDEEQDSMF